MPRLNLDDASGLEARVELARVIEVLVIGHEVNEVVMEAVVVPSSTS